jgi:hypothetical protein
VYFIQLESKERKEEKKKSEEKKMFVQLVYISFETCTY